MEQEVALIYEVAGKPKFTPEQQHRLDCLDWYIDTELPQVMQESKEYGVLQAQWKHSDRMNKLLFEGLQSVIINEAKVQSNVG